MKAVLVNLVFVSGVALAGELPSLDCTSDGGQGAARSFHLDLGAPASNLDSSDDEIVETLGEMATYSGNNGCDNDYAISFFMRDERFPRS